MTFKSTLVTHLSHSNFYFTLFFFFSASEIETSSLFFEMLRGIQYWRIYYFLKAGATKETSQIIDLFLNLW